MQLQSSLIQACCAVDKIATGQDHRGSHLVLQSCEHGRRHGVLVASFVSGSAAACMLRGHAMVADAAGVMHADRCGNHNSAHQPSTVTSTT
jgi:hypothetical protein